MYSINITGIPKWVSEIHLREFFFSCGAMLKARIFGDALTAQSHCRGSITFADKESFEKALKKNGELLDGVPITVESALIIKPSKVKEPEAELV